MERKLDALGPGPNTKVKRHADRAAYDRDVVHAIIDESLICHVTFVLNGLPFCLPTAHARIGDTIYLHGAVANQMCRSIAAGGRVCLAFTLLDGLVFARNAFHHSMNYRSVVAFGAGREVSDVNEKRVALDALVDHVAIGRSAEVGAPSDDDLKATLVIAVAIEEAAAKTRKGPSVDLPELVAEGKQWAGVVPLAITASNPVRDSLLPTERAVATSVARRVTQLGAESPVEQLDGELLFSSDKARLDVTLVHRFLHDDAYWAKGVTREQVQTSIDNALCVGVYRNRAQLGFARVVSDGSRFAYLADVFVIESERGRGLGKRLTQFALMHPKVAKVSRVLLGTLDAHALYERFGFVKTPPDRYMVKVK